MTVTELWTMLLRCSASIGGKFPSIIVFSEYSKLPEETIQKVYKKWLEEKKLTRDGNYYHFASDKTAVLTQPTTIEKIKTEGISSLTQSEKENIMEKTIKVLIGVIGFMLIACSIHFTYEFNALAMKPFWALMLSLSTVVFMSFAFTINSYIPRKRTRVAIRILWVVGITYSVFTAVSGQFNEFRTYNTSDKSMVVMNQNKILNDQLKTAKSKQSNLEHWRFEETKYTENTELKNENPGTWKRIQNGVEELKKVESEINTIQEKLLQNANIESNENETVYNWLSKFFGINPNIIQFFIILFPALFIDLCSSISLSFAFGKSKSSN